MCNRIVYSTQIAKKIHRVARQVSNYFVTPKVIKQIYQLKYTFDMTDCSAQISKHYLLYISFLLLSFLENTANIINYKYEESLV